MRKAFRSIPQALGVIALALGTLLTPSCTKDYISDVLDDDAVEMIISIGADTKTANEGDSTVWIDTDKLSVIHSANGSDFYASKFSYVGSNDFSGKVSRLSSTNDWYVIYPYKEENTAANALSFTFPASQTQTGNANKAHFAGDDFPMVGKSLGVTKGAGLSLTMENVLSAAEFEVTNTTDSPIIVKEVQFTATSPIAGAFTADMTGAKLALAAGSGATKVVKLTVENGAQIAAGGKSTFYMAVAPFTAPAGSSLKLKVTAVHPGSDTPIVFYDTKKPTSETTFTGGAVKTVTVAFDEDHSTNPDAGGGEAPLEPGEQPEDGTYLLVYENGENSLAFAPRADQASNNYTISVTVVDGVVIPQDGQDLSIYAVTLENTGEKHACDGESWAYNVTNADGYYVFYSSNGGESDAAIQIRETNTMSSGGTKYYHTFVQEEDGIQIRSAQNSSGAYQYLLTYSEAKGFHYSRDDADQGKKLHLYLIGEGAVKEKQHPYFDPSTVIYDFDAGGDFPEPELKDAYTPVVSWASSNEAVATVDANGNVTILKAGSATITATLDFDDTYYSATAEYTISATTSASQTFYLVTEIEAGETYLIVSSGMALTNNNGTIGATQVSPANGEVTVSGAESLVWTATTSGSAFTFSNNGYYLQRGSSNGSGGRNPNISQSPGDSYKTWNYDGNRLYNGSTSAYSTSFYYLYYSNSAWAQTSSESSAGTVALYSANKPLTKQNPYFAQPNVTWTLGEDGKQIGGTYDIQLVTDAQTSVTYESLNTNVATVSGTRVTIVAKGSATIQATAKEENGYKGATANYTLRIREPVTGDFIDLNDWYNDGEPFNLENDNVRRYLDDAESRYTDTNYKGSDKITVVSNYTGSSGRKDIPKPVPIQWETPSTGTATITIYSDEALTNPVWAQTTTSGKTSDDVYNLIPGLTYYCTVTDADETLLLKGIFETTGRRRMIQVSTTQSQNHGNNCRDLGGLKTTDGRRIKYGMIFRGTNLDGTKSNNADVAISNYVAPNNSEQGLLANYLNIGYDIDLRAGGTKAFLDKYNVTYVYGNMQPSLSDVTDANKARTTLQGFYDAAAAGKASYFHCAIGSDRTGFWGLLIEGLLGVSVKDCSIDFELTSFYNTRERTNTGYLFYQGMENTSGSFKGLANYDGADFQQKCAAFVKSLKNTQYNFTDEWIETFRNNVLEDL